MKPPKFTQENMIQDKLQYSGRELDLFNRGWRRTDTNHWTDDRSGRLDLDHVPAGEEVGYINFIIPKDEADKAERNVAGAIKTHEILKRRRTMQDSVRDILATHYTDDIIAKLMDISPEEVIQIGLHNATAAEIVNYSMLKTSANGSAKAAEYLRDTAGDKPKEQQEITVYTDADRELMKRVSERLGVTADTAAGDDASS